MKDKIKKNKKRLSNIIMKNKIEKKQEESSNIIMKNKIKKQEEMIKYHNEIQDKKTRRDDQIS